MRIRFLKSIKKDVDSAIDQYKDTIGIKHIELSEAEYIEFLEELNSRERIILSPPNRVYRGIKLEVLK